MLTGGDRGQPALRAQHRHHLGRDVRLQPGDHRELRQEVRHGDHGRVRRREPAAGDAQRGRDRAALAGQPRSDAGARPADLRIRSARISTTWRTSRRTGAPPSAATAIELSKQKEVVSAGFVETSALDPGGGESRRGCSPTTGQTAADYNLTARTPDGSGSGWASKSFNELRLLDPARLAARRSTRRCCRRAPPRSSRASTRWCSSPRRSPTCSRSWSSPPMRGRPTRDAASFRRRAAATASASRCSARRCGSIRIRRTRWRRR